MKNKNKLSEKELLTILVFMVMKISLCMVFEVYMQLITVVSLFRKMQIGQESRILLG